MIGCELQLDSILGELVRAGHNPCIVSSEEHVSDYHVSESSTTPAVLNSEYLLCFRDCNRYVHEEVQMLVR